MVLKPTRPVRRIIPYAPGGKSCAFYTQHLPPPTIPRLTGHEMTPNLRGCMLHCSASARYQVYGSWMGCGRSSCSRRESLAHFWPFVFRRNWDPSEKETARNGPDSDVSSEKSGDTASTTLKLGSEHSQSSGAYGLEGLTLSRAL